MILDLLSSVNIISALIICIFVIPILVGIIRPLTSWRIHRSVQSLLNSLILLASVVLSVWLTNIIFSGDENFVLTGLSRLFPSFENAAANKEIWVYFIFGMVLLLAFEGVLHLLAWPVKRYAVAPVSNKILCAVDSMNGFARRVIGGLWQLPKSVVLVLVFSILFFFYAGFFNSSFITEDADTSAPYQLVQANVIRPLLNTTAVKDIEVILGDSFAAAESEYADGTGNLPLIRYFNGVTLAEAIRSNEEIDEKAKEIVGMETDDKRKAYLIYLWICNNIKYDNDKAAMITKDPSGVSSGAIVAFAKKMGVCFDFSCLYVAMCRAASLKVRFIIGLGYSGVAWGDHAWNQVYYPKEDQWINVDTAFGSAGVNYFDNPHFHLDHKDGVIQGEW